LPLPACPPLYKVGYKKNEEKIFSSKSEFYGYVFTILGSSLKKIFFFKPKH